MTYIKLPTWKEYVAALEERGKTPAPMYYVTRFLLPKYYPTWGILTDAFRLTQLMPESFLQALKYHEEKQSFVRFKIVVTDGAPTLVCEHRKEEGAIPEGDLWYTVKTFTTWVALDLSTKHNVRKADEVDSKAMLSIDERALKEFMPELKSLPRQAGARKPKKAV
jgi:hypothetical protein